MECINNDFDKIKSSLIKDIYPFYKEIDKHLFLNKKYIVYAIEFSFETFVYIIEDDKEDFLPTSFPLELFKIIDPRISKSFIYGNIEILINKKEKIVPLISFKEWANDINFYNKLSDYEIEYEKIFESYKEKIDYEFFNPNLILSKDFKLEKIEKDWVMCENCFEAWQPTQNEMLKCQKCNNIYINPYKIF